MRRINMNSIERHYTSPAARPFLAAGAEMLGKEDDAIASRVRASGRSFFWAMRILPPPRRKAMYALYAFYREVEDIAHGEASPLLKQALLFEWRTEISRLYARQPRHALTCALLEAMRLYDLRCEDFLAIIEGMERDARTDLQAPSLEELDLYCARVAVSFGLISVRIFGVHTPAAERVAVHLGRALQLTNILRDVGEDAARNRLYLPRELLQARGIDATMPNAVLRHPALPNVCRDVAMLAEKHYAAATQALAICPRHSMRPAALTLAIYRTLLSELLARGWRSLEPPVRIPAWRKAALVLRNGLMGA
jgi:presqualene diphosphate synthase